MLRDQLGSVRRVINIASGAVTQALEYDANGVVTRNSAASFQPFAYAGGLADVGGLTVHFGARDYDARTGRWLQPDPIGVAGGSNRYTYSENDAIDFSDPTGLRLTCSYAQGSGHVVCRDDTGKIVIDRYTYSGYLEGRNNPAMQDVKWIDGDDSAPAGPIPQGVYDFGEVYRKKYKHKAAPVIRLEPQDAKMMFNRGGMLVHGDNEDHTASRGCVILNHDDRVKIANAGGGTLTVTP